MDKITTRFFNKANSFFYSILFCFSCLFCLISFNAQAFDFLDSKNITSENYDLNALYSENNDRVYLTWTMSNNNYLYKDKIEIKILNPDDLSIKAIRFPNNYHMKDTIIGRYPVYSHELTLPIILNKTPDKNFDISITYQGCSDSGFCYAPITDLVKVDINKLNASVTKSNDFSSDFSNDFSNDNVSLAGASSFDLNKDNNINNNIDDNINNNIDNQSSAFNLQIFSHSIFIIILICFGLGLLLSFTPCVLPMIPILSSIILGQKSVNMKRGFLLSSTYVLSMALTYASLGILISLLGQNFQLVFQKPVFLISLSIVFVLLSLGLLGFFNLRVFKVIGKSNTLGIANKINQFSLFLNNKVKGGSYLGVFGMGVVSTVIVSSCVTPALIGILAYIAQSGNVVLGGVSLFFLGLGMGVPLLVVGTFGPKFLPKRGNWMVAVKVIFAVLLLGVAASLVWRALPTNTSASSVNNNSSNNVYVTTIKDFDLSLNKAKAENKPVVIYFYADWCLSCRIMHVNTFANSDVKETLNDFVFIHVDMTRQTKDIAQLQKRFGIIAPPSIVFYKSDSVLNQYNIFGEIGPAAFNDALLTVINNK